MSNLLGSLRAAADTLDVLQRSVAVSQNNVMNATTPGYVRQSVALQAREFMPGSGLLGGVETGALRNSRDEYAEKTVRDQATQMGKVAQDVRSLTSLEGIFSLDDANGVPANWNRLLQSFSAWSVTPNSAAAQQNVLDSASALAQSFQSTARNLSVATKDTENQIQDATGQLNSLVGRIRDYNERRQNGNEEDAGLDAQVHETLEQLSELADVKAIRVADGTYTLLLNGQRTLLVGARQNLLGLQLTTPVTPPPVNPGAAPSAYIVDLTTGQDLSSHVTTGKLGSLLAFRNQTLPAYQGDSQKAGLLNEAAAKLADRVNAILSPGTPLFTYDGTSAVKAALSIAVNPSVNLAAVPADAAGITNGRQLQLAGLASPISAADQISGMSYSAFFGQITAGVGQKLADAKASSNSQTELIAQARALRAQFSGISLDEEAVHLVEFQRAYQATSRMVTVINEMNEVVMGLIR